MKQEMRSSGYISGLREVVGARRNTGVMLREEAVLEDSPTAMIAKIRHGLAIGEFSSLASWLASTEDELARWLGLSRATLHRRKKSGQLDATESERLIRVARLMARACEVFESDESARSWLKRPALALAGESPLGFADTGIGAREVEVLLGRLEHGVFS